MSQNTQEETNALAVKELRYQGFEADVLYHEVRIQAWNRDLTDAYEFSISKYHAEYLAQEFTKRLQEASTVDMQDVYPPQE